MINLNTLHSSHHLCKSKYHCIALDWKWIIGVYRGFVHHYLVHYGFNIQDGVNKMNFNLPLFTTLRKDKFMLRNLGNQNWTLKFHK